MTASSETQRLLSTASLPRTERFELEAAASVEIGWIEMVVAVGRAISGSRRPQPDDPRA